MPKKKAAPTGPKKPLSRSQKILRGPLFWIIAAIVGVTVFGQVTNAGNQYTQIKTSQALDAISKSDVESAVLIDKEQKLRLELKTGKTINGSSKVVAAYVVRQEPTVIDALTGNPPPSGWTVEVPRQSLFFSFLFSFAPIAAYLGGLAKKSLISRSSAIASSAPATSAKVVCGTSGSCNFARERPNENTFPPPCA